LTFQIGRRGPGRQPRRRPPEQTAAAMSQGRRPFFLPRAPTATRAKLRDFPMNLDPHSPRTAFAAESHSPSIAPSVPPKVFPPARSREPELRSPGNPRIHHRRAAKSSRRRPTKSGPRPRARQDRSPLPPSSSISPRPAPQISFRHRKPTESAHIRPHHAPPRRPLARPDVRLPRFTMDGAKPPPKRLGPCPAKKLATSALGLPSFRLAEWEPGPSPSPSTPHERPGALHLHGFPFGKPGVPARAAGRQTRKLFFFHQPSRPRFREPPPSHFRLCFEGYQTNSLHEGPLTPVAHFFFSSKNGPPPASTSNIHPAQAAKFRFHDDFHPIRPISSWPNRSKSPPRLG